MSAFSSIIFVGTSVQSQNKLFSWEIFSIDFILGWSLYFRIDCKIVSLILLEKGSGTRY